MSEPTFTLAAIHERHEQLEEANDHVQAWMRNDPDRAPFLPAVPPGLTEFAMRWWVRKLHELEPTIRAELAAEIEAARAQLKLDATAAYVAFMGGD